MRRSLLATTFGLLAIAASASAAQQPSKPASPTTTVEKSDTTKHHKKEQEGPQGEGEDGLDEHDHAVDREEAGGQAVAA